MCSNYILQANVPTFGLVDISFYGKAQLTFDLYLKTDEFEREKKIKHLGLISNVFDSVTHTRFDYLMLQSMLVDVFDKFHPSESPYSVGSIKINGKSELGNGILKAWFMLSNFGHTFNTLADEKALVYYFFYNREKRKIFIEKIKDYRLRKWAKKIISNLDYYKFHYLLGVIRVYEEIPQGNFRTEFIKLYKLLLLDEETLDIKCNFLRLTDLRTIFNTIRILSIVGIDSHYSHTPFTVNLLNVTLNLRKDEDNTLQFIYSILGLLNKDLYLNREVLCMQQSYIQEIRMKLELENIFERDLFEQLFHSGLIKLKENKLKNITRITLNEKNNIFTSNVEFIGFLEDFFVEEKVYINLDRNIYQNEIYIDFFTDRENNIKDMVSTYYLILALLENFLEDKLYLNNNELIELYDEINLITKTSKFDKDALEKIEDVINGMISAKIFNDDLNDIVGMYEYVFWDIIKLFFQNKYKIVVNKNNAQYNHFAVWYHNKEKLNNINDLECAINYYSEDKDRIHELKHLQNTLKRKYQGFKLYLIERATIYDATKPLSERITTDIDSVVLKIKKNELVMDFNESKNTKNKVKDAKKDLKAKFIKTFSSNAKGYRTIDSEGFGAKIQIRIKKDK